jgi:hypothetical protein
MGIDLKKEIKLSDLFRRRAKEPGAEREPDPQRARRRLFARKPKAPKEAEAPRAPRGKAAPKAGPALPAVPLMRAFNLLPREAAREKKGLPLAHVGVALLGLVVFAGLAGGFVFLKAGVTARTGERDDLRAQRAALEVPPEPGPDTGEDALAGEGAPRTTALSAALTGRVAWDRVLREFSLVLPEDVWLTGLSAATANGAADAAAASASAQPTTAGAGTFTMTGFAETQSAVARLLSRLELIPELGSVKLQSSTQNADRNAYSFTIIATVDSQAEPS